MIDDMRMTNDGRGVRDVVPAMRAVGCATAEREGASSDARGGRDPIYEPAGAVPGAPGAGSGCAPAIVLVDTFLAIGSLFRCNAASHSSIRGRGFKF